MLTTEINKDLWDQILAQVVEGSASPERASGLLRSAVVEHIDTAALILSFPNALTKSGVDRSYIEHIKDAIFGLTNIDMDVKTIVSSSGAASNNISNGGIISLNNPVAPRIITPAPQKMQPEADKEAAQNKEDKYTKKLTFNTFVVGESNGMAYSAAMVVAEKPGKTYNPLFIYGRSGLGKTHLLCSIENYISQSYPYLKARYFQAKELLDDLITMNIQKNWDGFNQKYYSADIIMIDDIQFLEGKKESTERVFQLLNSFIDANKQVVISADRSPKEIDMDERMTSRFMKGLVTDIQPPTFETKLGIIKNYIAREMPNVPLSDNVLTYIAEISSSNIREIEGALNRIESYYSLGGKEITAESAQQILRDFFPDKNSKNVTIAIIQREIERAFDISHEEMVSSKRERRINNPRQIAMYLCRELTSESYPAIGRKFGNRDHSTVMHGVDNIEKQLKVNRELYDRMDRFMQIIKEKA